MQYSQFENQYYVKKAFQETWKNNLIDNVKKTIERKSIFVISSWIKVLNKYDMIKNLNNKNENKIFIKLFITKSNGINW